MYLKGTNFREDLFLRGFIFAKQVKNQINLELMKILRAKETIAFYIKHHLNLLKT